MSEKEIDEIIEVVQVDEEHFLRIWDYFAYAIRMDLHKVAIVVGGVTVLSSGVMWIVPAWAAPIAAVVGFVAYINE